MIEVDWLFYTNPNKFDIARVSVVAEYPVGHYHWDGRYFIYFYFSDDYINPTYFASITEDGFNLLITLIRLLQNSNWSMVWEYEDLSLNGNLFPSIHLERSA